jgi:hypothetical protein
MSNEEIQLYPTWEELKNIVDGKSEQYKYLGLEGLVKSHKIKYKDEKGNLFYTIISQYDLPALFPSMFQPLMLNLNDE